MAQFSRWMGMLFGKPKPACDHRWMYVGKQFIEGEDATLETTADIYCCVKEGCKMYKLGTDGIPFGL